MFRLKIVEFFCPFTCWIMKFAYICDGTIYCLNCRWNCLSMWYLENNFSWWLRMWQHKFSQAEEGTSKISAHCTFDMSYIYISKTVRKSKYLNLKYVIHLYFKHNWKKQISKPKQCERLLSQKNLHYQSSWS